MMTKKGLQFYSIDFPQMIEVLSVEVFRDKQCVAYDGNVQVRMVGEDQFMMNLAELETGFAQSEFGLKPMFDLSEEEKENYYETEMSGLIEAAQLAEAENVARLRKAQALQTA